MTVNAVAPGLIDTRMLNESVPEAILGSMTERIPIGRMGRPDDIAASVAFLCSQEAGYITGQVLEVHGGFTELTPSGPGGG